MELQDAFNSFYEKIEFRALSEERIGRAWGRLHTYLAEAYGLSAEQVFIQGSYANETAIRPAEPDGEYDLDIIAICVDVSTASADAIAELRAVLERDSDLAERLEADEPGRPCVRLGYAPEPEGFGFHVDIAPARTGHSDAPLDVPMRGREDWSGTAPLEYTQWCLSQGDPFRRTVRELKRWRDVHDAAVNSIVLQVLIGYCMPQTTGSDAERIVLTLENIKGRLVGHTSSPPRLENPVLPSEDLAARWDDTQYQRFLRELDEAITVARRAWQISDEEESHKLWRQLFGKAFPGAPARRGGGTVAPPPDTRRPAKPQPDRGRHWG